MSGTAVLTPEGINTLITAAEAASLCGVSTSTIYVWVNRGNLTVSGKDERGHNLYRLLDVAKAERATRAKARRHP
ncbi:MerR-like transcriptional regulator [Mycobacterium phage KristaRAM]|uniref:MerR-like HTH DNA binding protein n=1 Tax=Mycobacterium phage KristaRAM TaxID=2301700 RepID=A0A385DZQ0_9CAUD|nr:MerR-like transcriptional regulator [Mycobacterium phage KristaRAM]AXQ64157.1 MerR-like HTH DNA binding protein [Mycobacterium phage KristaRAM]